MHSDNKDRTDTAASCDRAYRSYGSLLYRLCYSFLSSGADAEDAVQEVFYRFMKKAPRFSCDEHEKAWFISVAQNVSRDMLRRRRVRTTDELDELNEAAEPETEEKGVLNAIFALPEKYRTVFVLHYLEENSVSDTAQLTGISESAVKMRLSRGRELLRGRLGDMGGYNA